jgi:uncharacterized membrane protein YdjX (TVP38/TMEM64 family)
MIKVLPWSSDSPENCQEPAMLRLPKAFRVVLGLALVALVFGAWQLSGLGWWQNPNAIRELVAQHPIRSILIFFTAYVVAVTAAIPTLPFNLAAGWIWGAWWGGLLSAAASSLGAAAAFVAARGIFGQPLRRRSSARFIGWIQSEFERGGWRFIAFIRLNPVFPSAPMNYLLGLSSVRMPTYLWATAVFLTPPSMLIAMVGASLSEASAITRTPDALRVAVMISAAVTILFALRYAARYIARPWVDKTQ